jgi:hypothetical protein
MITAGTIAPVSCVGEVRKQRADDRGAVTVEADVAADVVVDALVGDRADRHYRRQLARSRSAGEQR